MALTNTSETEYKHWQPERVEVVGDRAVRFRDICVHEIRMGDVEDPDMMVSDPMWKWQESDAGKFIMENAVEKPYWIRQIDHTSWGHVYRIMARLSEQNETYFRLKFK